MGKRSKRSLIRSAKTTPLKHFYAVAIITCLPFNTLKGQMLRLIEAGFLTGYGYGTSTSSLPEGTYSPVFLKGIFGYTFSFLETANRSTQTEIIFEPQVNWVLLRAEKTSAHTEAGVGFGVQQRLLFLGFVQPFIRFSTGPFYFSTPTVEQRRGFVFNDAVTAGIYFPVKGRWAAHAEFQARHLSNANLFLPNHGINTYNFLIGASYFL